MAKKKNVFSAIGAGKMIGKRRQKQQAMLDEMDNKSGKVSPGERRRRKLVEEAGGSYND